jgi:hypothetical protein
MKRSHGIAVVAAGYAAAMLVAAAAVSIRIANTSVPDAEASGGMHAFGDALLFVWVFGVVSLLPTGAALLFLRTCRSFWRALSALGVAVALTGVAAGVLFLAGRHAPPSPLATWAGLSVLRILVAPIAALAFLECAVLSPSRPVRVAFLVATAMEAATSGCGAWAWIVPLLFDRA